MTSTERAAAPINPAILEQEDRRIGLALNQLRRFTRRPGDRAASAVNPADLTISAFRAYCGWE